MTEKSSDAAAIAERVKRVRYRMEEAAVKAGRNPADITLVGVTKTQTAEAVRALIKAGVDEIGENRVQELLQKAPFLQDLPHKSHLIGHLQRNKAKYLPGQIQMLQSLSSVETLVAIEKAFAAASHPLDVLVEVNIGDESSKTGVDAGALNDLVDRVLESPVVRFRGLMAIPPFVGGSEVRQYFAQMHQLFVDIRAKKMDNGTVNVLSMGMSSDFEEAIAEGSTMVRVGTDLFGPRQYA